MRIWEEAAWHDRLVDAAYAAALGEASWQHFLELLVEPRPAARVLMLRHWLRPQRGEIAIAHGLEQPQLDSYRARYAAINPWMARMPERAVGVVTTTEWALPRAELLKTEFHADYLRPQGLEAGCGVTVLSDGDRKSLLSVLDSRPCALDDLIPRAMAMLHPHLRRAFGLARRVTDPGMLDRTLVEHLAFGVIYLSDERRVRFANARARRILERGEEIGTDLSGRFRLADDDITGLADQLLHHVGSGVRRRVCATRQHRSTGRPWQILFIRPAQTSAELFFAGGRLIVLVVDPDEAGGSVASLAEAYGLSPAEERLADALLAGGRLAELAERWRLSKETLRKQLASILAKMGVHGQADLIREALRSPSSMLDG